jgi:hypothetical protein
VIKSGLLAGSIAPALGLIGNPASGAADLAPLDPKDPAAVTLGFYNDSTKVDVAANPRYLPTKNAPIPSNVRGSRVTSAADVFYFPAKVCQQQVGAKSGERRLSV